MYLKNALLYIIIHNNEFFRYIIMKTRNKKNIINKLIYNVSFSCFHNYVSKKMHLLDVLFSHFWSQIYYI